MKRGYFSAVATLIGCTVGAGIFGIPYVIAQAGFLTGLLALVLIGIIMTIVSLYVGEICLRTNGNHQLPVLAEKYLGKNGKFLLSFILIISIYGALIAYGIGSGIALKGIFGGNELIYSLIFYGIVSALIFFSLKIFMRSELVLSILTIIITIIITILSFSNISLNHLQEFSITKIYIPYGVILFSYLGIICIPEMKQELKDKKLLKRSIILGILISGIIYFLFALAVVGVNGINTTEVATVGLGQALGFKMLILANIFALIAMSKAFIALGYSLKDTYRLDFKIKHLYSWLLVISIPLIIIITQLVNFITILNLLGVITDAILLTLILVMHSKAQKQGNRMPEYSLKDNWLLKSLFIVIFIIGMIQILI